MCQQVSAVSAGVKVSASGHLTSTSGLWVSADTLTPADTENRFDKTRPQLESLVSGCPLADTCTSGFWTSTSGLWVSADTRLTPADTKNRFDKTGPKDTIGTPLRAIMLLSMYKVYLSTMPSNHRRELCIDYIVCYFTTCQTEEL